MNNLKVNFKSIKKETQKAVLMTFETGNPIWLAKSQININIKEQYISLPVWLYTNLLQKNNITIKIFENKGNTNVNR